jgi:hypothetical protein
MPEISKPSGLSKTWAKTGQKREQSDTKITTGWVVEIPTFQDFNWLENRQDEAIAHINQHGLPVWDNGTEYQSYKSYIMGSDGNIYVSKTTHTNSDPTSDTSENNWQCKFVTSRKSLPVITPNLANSWGNVSAAIRVMVSDGIIFITGNITGGTITDGTNIIDATQIPARYRPTANRILPIIHQDGANYLNSRLLIGSDGTIKIYGVSANTNVIISGGVTQ